MPEDQGQQELQLAKSGDDKTDMELVSGFPPARAAFTSTTERLQLTIDLPDNVDKFLEPPALEALKRVGQQFLARVLQEANQVAVDESQTPLSIVKQEHVLQAQTLALRRLRARKSGSLKMLHFVRDIFIGCLGAAAGLAIEHQRLATAFALAAGVGLYLCALWSDEE
ncbi:MAG: hypothetical protein ABR874_23495 [Candidatus Sulfotelmatobacter sp.]|jgi:hypothetical protein